uniref:Chaperonin GroEL, chloroplastic n=1 Tax=Gracilaria tenuistipitata var. liui TaxID=285951 RepID=CH60_GRATL|nr:chaperonin GroEL [Gracilaria tenuistipitata var. liui]Q6B911.1 RecName: Full=Chaperonin GroEL, chloroplastic; AltName: Full=60 kDa chaperonin; AltName: Full=Chaperonin-60; Short=Cpn60 [Gracilaria tenuistipitata var. liui]AAT79624.1 60 kDa chaperonin [Gracilaria tenuistipitata var. liui]
MAKKILYQDNARKALEKGMDTLVEAVAITLGPKGRNVVLERKFGAPQIINDGVTIAKEIELQDLAENTGVALIRQAASKTNDVAGDGTTTATVLAHAIVKQGLKNVAAGANPITLKKGIQKAVKFVVGKIAEYSKPICSMQDVTHIGSISSGNDVEVGTMIANAIQQVGKEGIISLEEGQSTSTELDIKEGMKFDKGFISPYFVTDTSRMEVIQDNPYILITDKKITLIQQELLPILEKVTKTGRPLLIIAEDIEKEALATIIVNKLRGIINVVAVRAPGFGDRRKLLLEDIAILTSGVVITQDMGLSLDSMSLDQLGSARRVQITKDSTTIVADAQKDLIQARCDQIRRQLEAATNSYAKDKLHERLAKLSGGVAVVKVGAATETEMRDKKLRLEDAINATKAAIEEGIVPGGGSTFVHLSEVLRVWAINNLVEEELVGALIIVDSLLHPLKRIVENAGNNGSIIIEKIKNSNFSTGYNADIGQIVDMYKEGIIDPAKVTRSALQNAASIASMILTTECLIAEQVDN